MLQALGLPFESLKPLRCQPTTVWGFTMTRALCQSGHRRESATQNARSALVSVGRLPARGRSGYGNEPAAPPENIWACRLLRAHARQREAERGLRHEPPKIALRSMDKLRVAHRNLSL